MKDLQNGRRKYQTLSAPPPLRKEAYSLYLLCKTGVLWILLAACLLTGCDTPPEARKIDLRKKATEAELQQPQIKKSVDLISFGFDLRRNLEEDTRQYLSLLKYLTKTTGLRFRLQFTLKNEDIAAELGTGVLQFAAVGAGTYIVAHEQYGVIPIVRGLNAQGKTAYRSVLITAPESSIQQVEDLRGRRFAFGSENSTQGNLIPRIILAQHGIRLQDLAAYAWTGSHRNCANAVLSGAYDAGGMQDTLGRELARKGLIRIFYTSRYILPAGLPPTKMSRSTS